MAIDATVLKNSIIVQRDKYLTNGGKFNVRAKIMQEILTEMSETDVLIVPLSDLICPGLEIL